MTYKRFKINMEKDTNAVEATAVTAATQEEVNQTESTASETHTEDFLEVLEAKEAELAKIREERDNYKKGMLKAKGKLEDDDDQEDIEAKIERMVSEKILATREAELIKEKDDVIKALARKNAELTTALKNRSQISTGTGAGTNTEAQPVSDNVLSAEQIKSLKAKGWSDDKISRFRENLLKNRG